MRASGKYGLSGCEIATPAIVTFSSVLRAATGLPTGAFAGFAAGAFTRFAAGAFAGFAGFAGGAFAGSAAGAFAGFAAGALSTGRSRTTSAAFLSGRKPWNDGWRS